MVKHFAAVLARDEWYCMGQHTQMINSRRPLLLKRMAHYLNVLLAMPHETNILKESLCLSNEP